MHVFVLNENTCILGERGYKCSCSTETHVYSLNKNACVLVQKEHMYSCWTRRHELCSTRICVLLLNNNQCTPVQREHMCSCSTRTHVVVYYKNTDFCIKPKIYILSEHGFIKCFDPTTLATKVPQQNSCEASAASTANVAQSKHCLLPQYGAPILIQIFVIFQQRVHGGI